MDLQTPTEEATVKAVTANLAVRFPSLEKTRVEATVRQLVNDKLARARVKNFVGILAEREAKAELQQVATRSL